MMSTILLPLAAAALAIASPATRDPDCIPRYSTSRGFKLVINVTDLAKDFTPSINGWSVGGVHIGPAQNRGVATAGQVPTFYQNGTYEDNKERRTSILTDGGTPEFWEGFQTLRGRDDTQGQEVYVLSGGGTPGIMLTSLGDPYSYLDALENIYLSTFLACNSTIPYYGNFTHFITLNWLVATRDANGHALRIPENCVSVNLIPQCANLEPLLPNATASHEWAQEIRCYRNVSAIDWSKYVV
jgi:hypothetical protein